MKEQETQTGYIYDREVGARKRKIMYGTVPKRKGDCEWKGKGKEIIESS